jgi:hypothetical protein
VEKSKKIGEIDPKSAIEATGVQPPIHERIVPLNHHEAFALKTIHRRKPTTTLSDALHHQGEASGQEAAAENRRGERQVRACAGARMCAIEQVTHPSLNHEHRQRKERTHAEPP